MLRSCVVACLAALLCFAAPEAVWAQTTSSQVGSGSLFDALAPQFDMTIGGAGDGEPLRISGPVGIVLIMGLLAILPTLLLLMTSFTRVFIVLTLLRQAIGAQGSPPGHLIAAISLLLTGFIMMPTLEEANRVALQPFLAGELTQAEAMAAAVKPFREFMYEHTREDELAAFIEMSGIEPDTIDDVPTTVLASAFVVGELKTAFMIAFFLYLPFLIIDMVVTSALMALGAFMLPPVIVSLPFKLLLFVLMDGWMLVIQSLVLGYR